MLSLKISLLYSTLLSLSFSVFSCVGDQPLWFSLVRYLSMYAPGRLFVYVLFFGNKGER